MNRPASPENSRQRLRSSSALGGVCAILALAVLTWFLMNGTPARPAKRLSSPAATPALENGGVANPAALSAGKRHLRQSPKAEAKISDGPDAANFYKAAFALYDRLTDEEKKILAHPKEQVDDDTAKALHAKIQPIIDLLKQAAQINQCDWGFGDRSFDTPMPQLTKSMDLGKLALWDATYEFPQDPDSALDILQARAQLGQNLSDVLIGSLVALSFNAGANGLIQENAAGLDPAGLQAAMAFLSNANPLGANLARAMQGETELVQNSFENLLNLPPEALQQSLSAISGVGAISPDAPNIENELKQILENPALVQAQLDHVTATESQFAQTLNWPNAQFQSWWQGVQSDAANYPFEAMLLPSLDSVRRQFQQSEVQSALVSAGLQVLQNGPGQLASITDPQTGLPFTYTPTATGFDLSSSFLYKGKPVTASFPTPPAR